MLVVYNTECNHLIVFTVKNVQFPPSIDIGSRTLTPSIPMIITRQDNYPLKITTQKKYHPDPQDKSQVS